MKLIYWILGIIFCLSSCDNHNSTTDSNFNVGRFAEQKFDFVRYKDTLSVSFLLDTNYHSIGYSIGMICSDGYKGFSNNIDTITVLNYDMGNIEKNIIDTSEIRKNVMKSMKAENRQVKNLTIEKNDGFVKSKFFEFVNNNIYMNCEIIDTLQKASICLQLETSKINSENELIFNTASNSFKYKTKKKKQ